MNTTSKLQPLALACLCSALVCAVVCSASNAQAQMTEEEESLLREKAEGPSTVYGIGPRFRGIWIADWQFDLFLKKHTSHWQDTINMEYGFDFFIRKPDNYEVVFGLGWADTRMPAGWWVGGDKDANDADWTEMNTSILVLDASYYKHFEISPVFSLYAGAGLGLAVLLGETTQQGMNQLSPCFAKVSISEDVDDLDKDPCLDEDGKPGNAAESEKETTDIPPVLPWINITLGSQFTFAEHYFLRIETGFKGYTFAGIGLGGQWY